MVTSCSSTTQEEVRPLLPLYSVITVPVFYYDAHQSVKNVFISELSDFLHRSDSEARHVQWTHAHCDFSQLV